MLLCCRWVCLPAALRTVALRWLPLKLYNTKFPILQFLTVIATYSTMYKRYEESEFTAAVLLEIKSIGILHCTCVAGYVITDIWEELPN
jgi:hypothetical protein